MYQPILILHKDEVELIWNFILDTRSRLEVTSCHMLWDTYWTTAVFLDYCYCYSLEFFAYFFVFIYCLISTWEELFISCLFVIVLFNWGIQLHLHWIFLMCSASVTQTVIPVNELIYPSIVELKRIIKCASLVVGHNGFGEFGVW